MAAANVPTGPSQALAEVSAKLVSLHKQFYGKGPVKATAFLVNDTIVCTLEGGFTIAERTLIDGGRQSAVHELRMTFHEAMEEQFTSVVEETFGRTVRAYMSSVHTEPDIAVDLFMLEPVDESGQGSHEIEVPPHQLGD